MAEETAVVTESTPATPAPEATSQPAQPVQTETPAAEPEQPFQSDSLIEEDDPAADPNQPAATGLDEFLSLSPFINTPEALQGAISDSNMLWEITTGQRPAGDMLASLKDNNPQVWTSVVNQLAEYIQKETGYVFAPKDQLQQQQLTPEMQRIQQLEQQLNQRSQTEAAAAYTQRVNQAGSLALAHVQTALKGSWLSGEENYVFARVGEKLAGKEEALIASIERGDFSAIDNALKQVRKEERERHNARVERAAKWRKNVAASQPKISGGKVPDGKESAEFDLKTREGRMKFAEAQFKSA